MSEETLAQIFNQKVILTDVDGVLLEYDAHLDAYLRAERDIHLKDEDWEGKRFLYEAANIDEDYEISIFVDFMHSSYFRSMPAKKCAQEVVMRLHKEGYRFIAITSVGQGVDYQDMKLTHDNRLHNLELRFPGVFDDVYMTNFHESKADILKQFNASLWVEDTVKNANIGHALGHHSVIMRSRQYRSQDNIHNLPVVDNWHMIETMIKAEGPPKPLPAPARKLA